MERTKAGKLDPTTLRVIYYFIERLNGILGKTHLQKMLFLADLLATKKFKEKITKLDYKKYTYGPYSEVINDYVSDLEGKGIIEGREFPLMSGDGNYFRYYTKGPASVKNKLIEDLGAEKVLLLDDIISSYGNMSLQDVLGIVYQLEIVSKAKQDTPLDIAKSLKEDEESLSDSEVSF